VLIDDKPIGVALNRDIAGGEATEKELDRLITRRHDARVSFARTLGVEQPELISRLDTFATKKGNHDRTR
jgi:hypothetical protein